VVRGKPAAGAPAVPPAGSRRVRIALEHGVSASDALYVALSAEEGVLLVTADARLARALRGSPHDVRLLEDAALS
jgi:predicted nucleic acid-binding protein